MPRYTWGGTVYDVAPNPDESAGGALKLQPGVTVQFWTTPTGGSVSTDYRTLDAAGAFTVAVTAIQIDDLGYFPPFQGPDNVSTLYHDPDPTDASVARLLWVARDAIGGVGGATEAAAGVVPLASVVEARAGTNTTKAVTPAGLAAGIDVHDQDTEAHVELSQAVSQLQTTVGGKADKPVPIDQLPTSQGAAVDKIPIYLEGGRLAVGAAQLDTQAPQLGQVKSLIGAATGADVRHKPLLTVPSSTQVGTATATTWTLIPDAVVPDARTGDVWECAYCFHVRGTNAAGFQVRFKTQSAAVTNKLANPGFNTDLANWAVFGNNSTVTRGTTAPTPYEGAGYARMEAVNTTGTAMLLNSEWVPAGAGETYIGAAYCMWVAGATPRNCRIDLQAADATGTILTTDVGAGTLPTTTGWTRVWNGTTGWITPAGTTQIRVRLGVSGAPTVGDVVAWDAAQLEAGSVLPAYGSTGGSGSSALAISGPGWEGLILTPSATPEEDYRRKVGIRYPTFTNLTAAFGLLGVAAATPDSIVAGMFRVAVGGTALSNQRIELEYAQRGTADAANPTTIPSGFADFARVAAA